MPQRCQYSTLSVPNDVSYANVAAEYVEQVGRNFGFDAAALQDISGAVRGIVTNIIKGAFDLAERTFI